VTRTERTFSSVPLIAVGVVVVGVLGLALSAWAFWPDDPSEEQADHGGSGTTAVDDTAATTTRPTSPTTADSFDDADQVHSTLAEGFHDDFAPYIDRSEADCLADAVVEALGTDRLREMASAGATSASAGELGPATPQERRDLDERMRPCVPDDTAARLGL
jgi:hypothetical protein